MLYQSYNLILNCPINSNYLNEILNCPNIEWPSKQELKDTVKTLNLKVEYVFYSKLISILNIFMLLDRGSS